MARRVVDDVASLRRVDSISRCELLRRFRTYAGKTVIPICLLHELVTEFKDRYLLSFFPSSRNGFLFPSAHCDLAGTSQRLRLTGINA